MCPKTTGYNDAEYAGAVPHRWLIEDIAHQPHWLNTAVQWHHDEWMRHGQWALLNAEQAHKNLIERQAYMQAHLCTDIVPSTFVAHDNLHLWGTVSLVYYTLDSEQAPGIWLTNMYVAPDYRSQGVGSALLAYVHQWAARQGIARVRLYTHDAARFYLKRGWQYERAATLKGQAIDILGLNF